MANNNVVLKYRRADIGFPSLQFIIGIFVLIVAVFLMFFLIRSQLSTRIDIQPLEMQIFLQRLIYAKDGISYYDDGLGRLYPGKIMLGNFNQDYFDKNIEPAIYYTDENRLIGAMLSLHESDGRNIDGMIVKYNRDFFDEKEVLYRAQGKTISGRGGVSGKEISINVILLDGNFERSGILKILVIMQNV